MPEARCDLRTAPEPVVEKVLLTVEVELTIKDPDVIERVTGPSGDEWRAQLYNLHTKADVLEHLGYNCVANGCENASMLDGWADLPPDAVEMRVGDVERSAFDVND